MNFFHCTLYLLLTATIALDRIVVGLMTNPSVLPTELLLYIHSTVAPFLAPRNAALLDFDDDDEDDAAVDSGTLLF